MHRRDQVVLEKSKVMKMTKVDIFPFNSSFVLRLSVIQTLYGIFFCLPVFRFIKTTLLYQNKTNKNSNCVKALTYFIYILKTI